MVISIEHSDGHLKRVKSQILNEPLFIVIFEGNIFVIMKVF